MVTGMKAGATIQAFYSIFFLFSFVKGQSGNILGFGDHTGLVLQPLNAADKSSHREYIHECVCAPIRVYGHGNLHFI